MSAGTYNVNIDQGSDYSVSFTFKDADNVAIDLTGHVFSGKIRKLASSTDSLADFEFDTTNANIGKIIMKL